MAEHVHLCPKCGRRMYGVCERCSRAKITEMFEDWWQREGRTLDPDTEDVPWFDKRKSLASLAFAAAMARSGNYVANDEAAPTRVKFENGRVVSIDRGILAVSLEETSS